MDEPTDTDELTGRIDGTGYDGVLCDVGKNCTTTGTDLLQLMMAMITSPLMADHAFSVEELEFNSKSGYYIHCGFMALNYRKHGSFSFVKTTMVLHGDRPCAHCKKPCSPTLFEFK